MSKYGQPVPPEIDLATIWETPIAMFVGENDPFATIESARWAEDQIGDAVFHFEILPGFDHDSFNYGKGDQYVQFL